jgi:isoleucyl-tRNA synthetase
VADESQIDQQLSADIQLAMRVASLGRAARAKAGIKVRQPIQTNVVGVTSEREKEILERVKPLVLEELNVKELKYDSFENVESLSKQGFVVVSEATTNSAIQVFIPENLKKEGMAREIVHRLQTMRRSAGFEIADHIVIYYQGGDYIRQVMTEFADYIRQETLAERLLEQAPEPGAFTESHKLGEHKVSLSVKRLD